MNNTETWEERIDEKLKNSWFEAYQVIDSVDVYNTARDLMLEIAQEAYERGMLKATTITEVAKVDDLVKTYAHQARLEERQKIREKIETEFNKSSHWVNGEFQINDCKNAVISSLQEK